LQIDAEIADYEVLLLEDKKTNVITDLKVNAEYDFRGSISDAANRFVIHFKAFSFTTGELPATIYSNGNEILVDLTLVAEQTEIKVYDLLGRLILATKKEGEMLYRFKMNSKNTVYIVVANSNGKTTSKVVLVH
jgi:hypothetical protein